jgi:hypothetical protein
MLKQEETVEEYIKDFAALQFQVAMFNIGFDELFFTSHFINGLKDELKGAVQSQLQSSVDRTCLLAKIQQQILERQKLKHVRVHVPKSSSSFAKTESSQPQTSATLWKERQLRDFRRANNLCYYCGEKFDAAHLQKCSKRNKPQVNAIVINDLDTELTEETLSQLEMEGVITAEIGQLSLNVISGTERGDSMRIRALVGSKVMLVLVKVHLVP